MKETLTVGNHISCLIEKVELNYILTSFTSNGVTYRGVLFNEGCSTVTRVAPQCKFENGDDIVTVELESEEARDRLLRSKRTYGPDYRFTKVCSTRSNGVNIAASKNLRSKKSTNEVDDLAKSLTLRGEKRRKEYYQSPIEKRNVTTPSSRCGKKSPTEDDSVTKSQILRGEKAQAVDDKLKSSKYVASKKPPIDNDNLLISRTLKNQKSRVQDDNLAKTSNKSQTVNDLARSNILRTEKPLAHDDNLVGARFLRSTKPETSRTLRDNSKAQDGKHISRIPTFNKKSQKDNVTKSQFSRSGSESESVQGDSHAQSKSNGTKKCYIPGSNLATSRTSRIAKSQDQNNHHVKPRFEVASKKCQVVDNNPAKPKTLATMAKSKVQRDNIAKSKTVGNKKSQGMDDNHATASRGLLRSEKALVNDSKLPKPRSLTSKLSQVKNDNLPTSCPSRVEKLHVQSNLAAPRILRSKNPDNLVTLRSKKSYDRGDILATPTRTVLTRTPTPATTITKVSVECAENEISRTKHDTTLNDGNAESEEGIASVHQRKKRKSECDNVEFCILRNSPPVKRVTKNTEDVNTNGLEEGNCDEKAANKTSLEVTTTSEINPTTHSIPVMSGNVGSQNEHPSIALKSAPKRIDRIALALRNIQQRKHERENQNLKAAYTNQMTGRGLGENSKSVNENKNEIIYIPRTSQRIELNKYKGKERTEQNRAEQKMNFNNIEIVKSLKEYAKNAQHFPTVSTVSTNIRRQKPVQVSNCKRTKDVEVNDVYHKKVDFHVDKENVRGISRIGKRKLSVKLRKDDQHDKVPRKSKLYSFRKQREVAKTITVLSGKNDDKNKSSSSHEDSQHKTKVGKMWVKHGIGIDMKALLDVRKEYLSEASRKKSIYLGELIMENPGTYRTRGNIERGLAEYGTQSRGQGLYFSDKREQTQFYLGRIGTLIRDSLGAYWTKDNSTRMSMRLSLDAKKSITSCETSKDRTVISPKPKLAAKKVISKHVRQDRPDVVPNRNVKFVKQGEGKNKVSPTVVPNRCKTTGGIKTSKVTKKKSSGESKKTSLRLSKPKDAAKKVVSKDGKATKVVARQSNAVEKCKIKGSMKVSPGVSMKLISGNVKTSSDSCKPKAAVKKTISKEVQNDCTKIEPKRDQVLASRVTKNSMEALVNVTKADLLSKESKEGVFNLVLSRLVTENLGTYWTKDNRDQESIIYGTRISPRKCQRMSSASLRPKVFSRKVISKHVRKNYSSLEKSLLKQKERKEASQNVSKEELSGGEKKNTSIDRSQSRALIKATSPTNFLKDLAKAAVNDTNVKCRTRGNVKGMLGPSKGNSSKGILYRHVRKATPNRNKWLNLSYERLRAYVLLRTLSMSTLKP